MYLTYVEYQSYGGTLAEASFNTYEYEAESIINWYTFSRLTDETVYSDAVKRCTYALIGLIKIKYDLLQISFESDSLSSTGASKANLIESQENDGVSISYNTIDSDNYLSRLDLDRKGNEFEMTVRLYLNNIKNSKGQNLLYRGLYAGE